MSLYPLVDARSNAVAVEERLKNYGTYNIVNIFSISVIKVTWWRGGAPRRRNG